MRTKSALLVSVGLGVLIAAGVGSAADAKTHHRHHAGDGGASALKSQVDSLTAAVSDLENRLNDTAQQLQATQARAAAAETAAAAAQADVQATKAQVDEQVQTIPGVVSTAVAANKPKPTWADGTKVGGQVFADLSYINQTPKPNKINGVGADIKRAYITVDHRFSDIYSADLTIDFAPNGIILNGGAFGTGTLQGSEVVKYAYVQAHYADEFVIQLGAEKTPWIPFVDDIAGYRYIDKHLVDQDKYGNSSDWGADVSGALVNGLINYSLMASDGAGYKTPSRSETMDFEGRVNLNYDGFVAAVGGYHGNISDAVEGSVPYQSVSRLDALAAYTNRTFRLGGEWFEAWDWKTPTGAIPATYTWTCTGPLVTNCSVVTTAASAATPPKQDRSMGYAFWGSYTFVPQWSIFARYDGLKPSEILDPKEHYDYVNAGIQYEPIENLDLALVYKHEDVNNAIKGGYADSTTTLAPGSTLTYNTKTHVYTPGAGSSSGQFDEFGIYTNFKF